MRGKLVYGRDDPRIRFRSPTMGVRMLEEKLSSKPAPSMKTHRFRPVVMACARYLGSMGLLVLLGATPPAPPAAARVALLAEAGRALGAGPFSAFDLPPRCAAWC